jgi:hypothetical protein
VFDELLEIQKRRDYKLVYVFTNCPIPGCGKKTVMLLHSTEYDLQFNRKNIKQWCGWIEHGGGNHLSRPHKTCNKCGSNYEIEAVTCINCEPRIKERTRWELEIESAQIERNRLGRHLKKGKITDAGYTRKIQDLESRIEKAKQELENMSKV